MDDRPSPEQTAEELKHARRLRYYKSSTFDKRLRLLEQKLIEIYATGITYEELIEGLADGSIERDITPDL